MHDQHNAINYQPASQPVQSTGPRLGQLSKLNDRHCVSCHATHLRSLAARVLLLVLVVLVALLALPAPPRLPTAAPPHMSVRAPPPPPTPPPPTPPPPLPLLLLLVLLLPPTGPCAAGCSTRMPTSGSSSRSSSICHGNEHESVSMPQASGCCRTGHHYSSINSERLQQCSPQSHRSDRRRRRRTPC